MPIEPINEIFYENRGSPVVVQTPQGNVEMRDVERLKVYQSSVTWDDPKFDLEGFYRAGHYALGL